MCWEVILGLVLGGTAVASFGATLTKIIPARAMLRAVGVLLVFLSVRTLVLGF